MPSLPDVLLLPLATALRVLDERQIPVQVQIARPRSKKFPLLDDHIVVRAEWTIEEKCNLVVAAKMGKEVR
jgi:hypothetical protein